MSDNMEQTPKRRGRPPKDLSDYHPVVDHARKLAKEAAELKSKNVKVEEWLEESGNVVQMCFKKASGTVYRQFYFRKDKNPDLYKTLRNSKNWK